MTNKKRITQARSHLTAGNTESYVRLMQAALRASMSTQTTNKITLAAKQDGIQI